MERNILESINNIEEQLITMYIDNICDPKVNEKQNAKNKNLIEKVKDLKKEIQCTIVQLNNSNA